MPASFSQAPVSVMPSFRISAKAARVSAEGASSNSAARSRRSANARSASRRGAGAMSRLTGMDHRRGDADEQPRVKKRARRGFGNRNAPQQIERIGDDQRDDAGRGACSLLAEARNSRTKEIERHGWRRASAGSSITTIAANEHQTDDERDNNRETRWFEDRALDAVRLVEEEDDIGRQRRFRRLINFHDKRRQRADQRQPERKFQPARKRREQVCNIARNRRRGASTWQAAPCFTSTAALAPRRISVRGGFFQPDAHGETLRHAHPIQRPLDIRHRARQIYPLLIEHAPADAVHDALDRLAAVDHRIHRHAIADREWR